MNQPHVKAEVPWTKVRIGSGVLASFFTILVLLVARNQIQKGFEPLGASMGSAFGTAAAICWWFTLRVHRPNSLARMAYAGIGGLVVGGIGFAVGFFGPLIFSPGSNQGPLLGIFITGPCGFTLGAILGAIAGFCFNRPFTGRRAKNEKA